MCGSQEAPAFCGYMSWVCSEFPCSLDPPREMPQIGDTWEHAYGECQSFLLLGTYLQRCHCLGTLGCHVYSEDQGFLIFGTSLWRCHGLGTPGGRDYSENSQLPKASLCEGCMGRACYPETFPDSSGSTVPWSLYSEGTMLDDTAQYPWEFQENRQPASPQSPLWRSPHW